ncbi:MAG: hypothetical protein QNJ34_11030 [Xenococcaceae cyanobacterium MO_188.B29]|nr:hypothetical protein [Xenococcaceae cyanobacterium MO_188.B29]
MNPQSQKQQIKSRRSPSRTTDSSSGLAKLILGSVGVVAVLLVVQSALGSLSTLLPSSRKLNLKQVELNPTATSQKATQTEAPRYGLDDKTVNQEQVAIFLRDNGAEDGDYVTLSVNGKVYAPNVFLRNAGTSVLVPLNPGANLVQIHGDRDGGGGVTLAADVSNQGNMTSSAFPEGATAMFYILRR